MNRFYSSISNKETQFLKTHFNSQLVLGNYCIKKVCVFFTPVQPFYNKTCLTKIEYYTFNT